MPSFGTFKFRVQTHPKEFDLMLLLRISKIIQTLSNEGEQHTTQSSFTFFFNMSSKIPKNSFKRKDQSQILQLKFKIVYFFISICLNMQIQRKSLK